MPPADTFVPVAQAQQQVRSATQSKQLQIEQLQHSLEQATETIARYKDPHKNPQVLQWQQQVTELNAKLYDTKKQLAQFQQENQQLRDFHKKIRHCVFFTDRISIAVLNQLWKTMAAPNPSPKEGEGRWKCYKSFRIAIGSKLVELSGWLTIKKCYKTDRSR